MIFTHKIAHLIKTRQKKLDKKYFIDFYLLRNNN